MSGNRNKHSGSQRPKTKESSQPKAPSVVVNVPVENPWDVLVPKKKVLKSVHTPADKKKNAENVFVAGSVPGSAFNVIEILSPPNAEADADAADYNDDDDDGFTRVAKPSSDVNTERLEQTHNVPRGRVRGGGAVRGRGGGAVRGRGGGAVRGRGAVSDKMLLEGKKLQSFFQQKPIKASHFLPRVLIQPHGESPSETSEQKQKILLFPVPNQPDRSNVETVVDGVWKDTTPVKENRELPVASMDYIVAMFSKHLTWRLVNTVLVDQEIEDLHMFSRAIVELYELAREQHDYENQLKLERLKVCLEKILVYSGFFLGEQWLYSTIDRPKNREEGFQHLAVWFYEIISIYQDLTTAYKNDGGDMGVVRTGHEKQSPDLATKNLLRGGFFTLLPHLLGDENRHLRSVFDDWDLEAELLSEKRISARILLQFVIWLLPQEHRKEKAILLTQFVQRVMRWNNETDSLEHLMGQLFSVE